MIILCYKMAQHMDNYLSLVQFLWHYDVVKEIDLFIAYARQGKLISRYSSLIVQHAELIKYWVIQHQRIITKLDQYISLHITGAMIVMHAIMQVEAGCKPEDEPIIPYLHNIFTANPTAKSTVKYLSKNPPLLRYYNNLLYVLLSRYQPLIVIDKVDYYINYYIHEIDPILATGSDVEIDVPSYNAEYNNLLLGHSNWLIYNYMLENYIATPWKSTLSFKRLFDNLIIVIANPVLLRKLETDILQRNWFNFTCYYIYMSYYHLHNSADIYNSAMNNLRRSYKNSTSVDYATINFLLRQKLLMRRTIPAREYDFIEEKIDVTEEIDYAKNGLISLHSPRPFLMKMIAQYGLYLNQHHLSILEQYYANNLHKPYNERNLYDRTYRNTIYALVVRSGLDYALLYTLSLDQMLGILYTGIYPNPSVQDNLLYNDYHGIFDRHIIAPQISRYLYYRSLPYVNITTLLDVLGSTVEVYDQISMRLHTIHVYPSNWLKNELLESLKSYFLVLPDNKLMAYLSARNIARMFPAMRIGVLTTYDELTLSNQQLADKYHIKNIYPRPRLIAIINSIKHGKSYIKYYRRSEHVPGDNKLWDIKTNSEIVNPTDIRIFKEDSIILSLLDASNGREQPTRFYELTGYHLSLINPSNQ